MTKRNKHLYISKVEIIDYCGAPAWYKMKVEGIYERPFEIEPTEGEHDYRTCGGCQKSYNIVLRDLENAFHGNEEVKAFPLCCEWHSRLLKIKEFDLAHFEAAPEKATKKILYVHQHIINSENCEDWYKRITDYFKWVFDSFGQMPKNCGDPLFSGIFMSASRELLEKNKEFDALKKERILEYFDRYTKPPKKAKTDINLLIVTYQKWLNSFPFDLNKHFQNLKPHFKSKIPFFKEEKEVNMYSKAITLKMHTESSLIDSLVHVTNDILTQINGLKLYESGLITDASKMKLDLAIQSRKLKLSEGYISKNKGGDQKYRKILKEWLRDETAFINQIEPMLKSAPEKPEETKQEIFERMVSKYGFFDLPKTEKLEPSAKNELVQKIIENGIPYAVAMLDYLDFFKHLQNQYFSSKFKLHREVSKWFNSDKEGRAIKGNMNVLSEFSKEDRKKYTSFQHVEKVKSDYLNLK